MLNQITFKKLYAWGNSIEWRFILALFFSFLTLSSCEDFVEIDSPKNLLDTAKVFENTATVESALANVYFNLRDQGVLYGSLGLSPLMGVYADELEYLSQDLEIPEIQQHTITASNRQIKTWWTQAYNVIYAVNDIIEGLERSTAISPSDTKALKGQALFVRALLHSILVNLFGDIPYITTTDYVENNKIGRESEATVYGKIIVDLEDAISLMTPREVGNERIIPDQITVMALLARVQLYAQNWEEAANWATQVIEAPGFKLENELSQVFIKESSEAIWQLKPEPLKNTDEANRFIINSLFGQKYALIENMVQAFEPRDLRRSIWIGKYTDVNTGNLFYFPYKYKEGLSTTESLEYSIIFRLAEQYLIRAEARAHLGQLSGAKEDLNRIRSRAGLSDTKAITEEELVSAIIKERRVELFSEYGHRWFDLKRTQKAAEALSLLKSNWRDTDILLPIPESELELNANLHPQNDGY